MSWTHVSKSASNSLVTHKQPAKNTIPGFGTNLYSNLSYLKDYVSNKNNSIDESMKTALFPPKHVVQAGEPRETHQQNQREGKRGNKGAGDTKYKILLVLSLQYATRFLYSARFI